MEPMIDESIATTKPSIPSNTVPIRISKSTARVLKSCVNKCNRKSHGKRVKVDAVIAKALALLDDSHIEEIQRATYTSQDHLEIEFKKYCSAHGAISKDEFLKILLKTALPGAEGGGHSLEESKED